MHDVNKPFLQLVMPQYPESLTLSNSRRPVYYLQGEKIPGTLKGNDYIFKGIKLKSSTGKVKIEYRLFHTGTQTFPLRNARSKDTPRVNRINGQTIWNGAISRHTRAKLTTVLHNYFEPYVDTLPFIDPPKNLYLHLEFIFYYPFPCREASAWQDYFNHSFPYIKTFEDTLVRRSKLLDDNPGILRGAYPHYVEVPSEEDRRLHVNFYYCKNNQIV